eukprot:g4351.t1
MDSVTDNNLFSQATNVIPFDCVELKQVLSEHGTASSRPSTRKQHRSTRLRSAIESLPELLLHSDCPQGTPFLNSFEQRGGDHIRNLSLPVVLESRVVSRRNRRSKTASMVTMLFGQKHEDILVTMHGNALFGQGDMTQPQENDDDCRPTTLVSQQNQSKLCEEISPTDSPLTVAQSIVPAFTEEAEASGDSVETSTHSSSAETHKEAVTAETTTTRMECFQIDDALETDVIVDTAKRAFQRTVQQSSGGSNASEVVSYSEEVDVFPPKSSLVKTTKTVVRELTPDLKLSCSEAPRENRSSDTNPPLSEDEDSTKPRFVDSEKPGYVPRIERCLSSPEIVDKQRRFLGRKSKKSESPGKSKTPKKSEKRSNRFRLFIECFGGSVLKEDLDTPSVYHRENPDLSVIPSRRVSDGKNGHAHRYSRRQAFIRTMMESHLDSRRK